MGESSTGRIVIVVFKVSRLSADRSDCVAHLLKLFNLTSIAATVVRLLKEAKPNHHERVEVAGVCIGSQVPQWLPKLDLLERIDNRGEKPIRVAH